MQTGAIVFTGMERVLFGTPAAAAIRAEAERLAARRVFLLTGKTLNRQTDAVAQVVAALGERFAGLHDAMPAHSPRDAVVACAGAARAAGCDLLVTIGGGSVTDGGKAVTLCLEHGIDTVDGLEPYRTTVGADGKRHFPSYRAPRTRLIAVPTTLSGGEFNARAGITDPQVGLKQSFISRGLIPVTVVLDPALSVHTPDWLWLSTGIRAVDHAVETYCSLDANDYTDGAALQALRLLQEGLARSKRDPGDLDGRLKCQIGAWVSMTGVVAGSRMGASHAIGHILGGSAGVPHGHTSCVMLPTVLAWNAAVNADRQRAISAALGQPEAPAAALLDRFIAGLGQPRRLRDVGVSHNRLPELAQNCLLDDWTFANPRPIRTAEQVLELLEQAY